ncbi:MAG: serine/threonine protein kinase [Victivallaceae bacterium]|nr:serine/threonine protein kinase [Victivallaceae bacterium]
MVLNQDGSKAEDADEPMHSTPPVSAKIGQVADRFTMGRRFAAGGYGEIFDAGDRLFERSVVIKKLRPELLSNPQAIERFWKEAKLQAQLDHPSVAPIYDLGTDDGGNLYLAMKKIEGVTLKTIIERFRKLALAGKLSVGASSKSLANRLDFFRRLCNAVDFAHNHGIAHCDLKPENVMLSATGGLCLMDWGCACALDSEREGNLIGTPAYLAPECYEDRKIHRSRDLFALGVILFELVSLKEPYRAATPTEVARKVRRGEISDNASDAAGRRIPDELQKIIQCCIEVDVSRRYRTVRELKLDVENYLFNREVSVAPDSPMRKLSRIMYRHRILTTVILAALLIGFLGWIGLEGYRRSVIRRELAEWNYANLLFQQRSDELAGALDRGFLALKSQLLMLAAGMRDAKGDEEEPLPIYSTEDFRSAATQPEDMADSAAYSQKISLRHPMVYLPGKMDKAAARKILKFNRSLASQRLLLLLGGGEASVGCPDTFSETNKREFLRKGGVVRRVFSVYFSGMVMAQPGYYEPINGSDVLSKWLRSETHGAVRWGHPYFDSDGRRIVSFMTDLYDRTNRKVGVAGLDIDMSNGIGQVLAQSQLMKSYGQCVIYLVNRAGSVMYSSRQMEDQPKAAFRTGATPKQGKLEKLPFGNLLDNMRRGGMTQQIFSDAAHPDRLIAGTAIPSMNWYFFAVVPRKALYAQERERNRP